MTLIQWVQWWLPARFSYFGFNSVLYFFIYIIVCIVSSHFAIMIAIVTVTVLLNGYAVTGLFHRVECDNLQGIYSLFYFFPVFSTISLPSFHTFLPIFFSFPLSRLPSPSPSFLLAAPCVNSSRILMAQKINDFRLHKLDLYPVNTLRRIL